MKIYIIKSTFVEKEKGLTNKNIWSNVYAVKTEEEAKKACIIHQNTSNDCYLGDNYKFVYTYEEITVY